MTGRKVTCTSGHANAQAHTFGQTDWLINDQMEPLNDGLLGFCGDGPVDQYMDFSACRGGYVEKGIDQDMPHLDKRRHINFNQRVDGRIDIHTLAHENPGVVTDTATSTPYLLTFPVGGTPYSVS